MELPSGLVFKRMAAFLAFCFHFLAFCDMMKEADGSWQNYNKSADNAGK